MESQPARPRSFTTYAAPAWQAFRTYWPAMLLIQSLALCLVLAYYYIDGAADFFSSIGEWKSRGGLAAAALCTMISGGLFPELIKRAFRQDPSEAPGAKELVHQFIMWAILGIFVDLFYQFQGMLFGTDTEATTVLCKVLFDQLVFTPLVPMSFVPIWFRVYQCDYNLRRVFTGYTLLQHVDRVIPLWITALSFWPIFLLIVYSLPAALQFPLFLFGNATYSILMIFIARRQGEEPGTD